MPRTITTESTRVRSDRVQSQPGETETEKSFSEIKNVHYSTDKVEIESNIELLGYEIERVYNINQNGTKITFANVLCQLETINKFTKLRCVLWPSWIRSITREENNPLVPRVSTIRTHEKHLSTRNPKDVKCTRSHLTTECRPKVEDNTV